MAVTTVSIGQQLVGVRRTPRAARRPGRLGEALRSSALYRVAVVAWMNALVAVVGVATLVLAHVVPQQSFPDPGTWAAGALKGFTLWCVAFLPGWLYVRFLRLRAGALWSDYVLNLHRLGWDDATNLPAPPAGGHTSQSGSASNVYRQKFDAYYGRRVSSAATEEAPTEDFRVSAETLFPVFLCTAVLAVGWAAVLWDTTFVVTPSGPWDALKFGFLGAYVFVISMLVRRFYQGDLRPSAYAGVVLRIILVMVIVTVLHQLPPLGTAPSGYLVKVEMVVAFVVGFFPLAGLQALQRKASQALRTAVPQLSPDYPLDQLDGLNVWYEARLAEEGVEDMQNLVTMNLVDVILHTRVPVGRLVDWVDQALLLIHLEPVDRKALETHRNGTAQADLDPASGIGSRIALRRVGIRTATGLLKALPDPDHPSEALRASGVDVDRLRILASILWDEDALAPVWNWQHNGVRPSRHPVAR